MAFTTMGSRQIRNRLGSATWTTRAGAKAQLVLSLIKIWLKPYPDTSLSVLALYPLRDPLRACQRRFVSGHAFQACRNSALMSRAFRRCGPNLGSSHFSRDTHHITTLPSRFIFI
jgi:hypothetical protein